MDIFPDIDKDTDAFCTAVLRELSDLNRKLSSQITKRVAAHPQLKDNKQRRKLAKIAIFYTDHWPLYERAAGNVRSRPEWRDAPPDSTVSAIYRNIYKLITDISYPGSVESKYEKQW